VVSALFWHARRTDSKSLEVDHPGVPHAVRREGSTGVGASSEALARLDPPEQTPCRSIAGLDTSPHARFHPRRTLRNRLRHVGVQCRVNAWEICHRQVSQGRIPMVSWFEVQRRARACPLRSFSLGEKVAEGRGRMRGHFVRRSCARQNKFTSSQEPPINEAGECRGHCEGSQGRETGRGGRAVVWVAQTSLVMSASLRRVPARRSGRIHKPQCMRHPMIVRSVHNLRPLAGHVALRGWRIH